MRGVPYATLERGVAATAGIDPDSILTHEKVLLAEFISDALKFCWDYYPWAEFTKTEVRYFRDEYDSAKTYASGSEVYYEGKYFRSYAETTGNLPTDLSFWYEVGDIDQAPEWKESGCYYIGAKVIYKGKLFLCIAEEDDPIANYDNQPCCFLLNGINPDSDNFLEIEQKFDRFIGYQQTNKDTIGTCLLVTLEDPRYNSTTPLDWREGREGIYIEPQNKTFNEVWIKYRLEAPIFTKNSADELVPSFLIQAVKAYAYKAWLIADGQHEKAQLQDIYGLDLLVRELDKLDSQQDRALPYTITKNPYRRVNAKQGHVVPPVTSKIRQIYSFGADSNLRLTSGAQALNAVKRRLSLCNFNLTTKGSGKNAVKVGKVSTGLVLGSRCQGVNGVTKRKASAHVKLTTGLSYRSIDIGLVRGLKPIVKRRDVSDIGLEISANIIGKLKTLGRVLINLEILSQAQATNLVKKAHASANINISTNSNALNIVRQSSTTSELSLTSNCTGYNFVKKRTSVISTALTASVIGKREKTGSAVAALSLSCDVDNRLKVTYTTDISDGFDLTAPSTIDSSWSNNNGSFYRSKAGGWAKLNQAYLPKDEPVVIEFDNRVYPWENFDQTTLWSSNQWSSSLPQYMKYFQGQPYENKYFTIYFVAVSRYFNSLADQTGASTNFNVDVNASHDGSDWTTAETVENNFTNVASTTMQWKIGNGYSYNYNSSGTTYSSKAQYNGGAGLNIFLRAFAEANGIEYTTTVSSTGLPYEAESMDSFNSPFTSRDFPMGELNDQNFSTFPVSYDSSIYNVPSDSVGLDYGDQLDPRTTVNNYRVGVQILKVRMRSDGKTRLSFDSNISFDLYMGLPSELLSGFHFFPSLAQGKSNNEATGLSRDVDEITSMYYGNFKKSPTLTYLVNQGSVKTASVSISMKLDVIVIDLTLSTVFNNLDTWSGRTASNPIYESTDLISTFGDKKGKFFEIKHPSQNYFTASNIELQFDSVAFSDLIPPQSTRLNSSYSGGTLSISSNFYQRFILRCEPTKTFTGTVELYKYNTTTNQYDLLSTKNLTSYTSTSPSYEGKVHTDTGSFLADYTYANSKIQIDPNGYNFNQTGTTIILGSSSDPLSSTQTFLYSHKGTRGNKYKYKFTVTNPVKIFTGLMGTESFDIYNAAQFYNASSGILAQ